MSDRRAERRGATGPLESGLDVVTRAIVSLLSGLASLRGILRGLEGDQR